MGVTTRKPQAGSTLLVSQLTVLLPCLICFGYCYFCMDWGFITQCLIKILRLCRGREPQNTMLLYHVNRVNSRPESEERPSALLEHRNKNETSSMLESELVRSIPSRDIAYRQAPVLAQRPPASILPLWALSRGSVSITTSHTSPTVSCSSQIALDRCCPPVVVRDFFFFFQHRKKTTGRVFFRLCGFL